MLLVSVFQLEGGMVEEARKVMGKIFKDHEAVIFFNHDFLQADNVDVLQGLQKLDFANRSDRKLIRVSRSKWNVHYGPELTPSLSPSIRIFLSATSCFV